MATKIKHFFHATIQSLFEFISKMPLTGKRAWSITIWGFTLTYVPPESAYPGEPRLLFLRRGSSVLFHSNLYPYGSPTCDDENVDWSAFVKMNPQDE